MGIRDVNVFALYGERKNTGDISAPFFPTNGTELFVASVGYDGGQSSPSLSGYGVVPVGTATATTTPTTSITAGATSVTLTSATGFVQGGFIQVDVNNTTTPTTSEVRKIATLAGSVVTFDQPLNFAHASSASLKFFPAVTGTTISVSGSTSVSSTTLATTSTTGVVNGMSVVGNGIPAGTTVVSFVANTSITLSNAATLTNNSTSLFTLSNVANQFVHTILPGNALPSMTIEKNIGGTQSLQFTGSRVGKFSLKLAAGEEAASMGVSVVSKAVNILDTPSSPISVTNESPFVFAEATLGLFGDSVVAQVTNVSFDIENGLKPTYTFNGSHDLQFLTPVTRKITGQIEVVFDSLDDPDWGYYAKMQEQVQGSQNIFGNFPFTPQPNKTEKE